MTEFDTREQSERDRSRVAHAGRSSLSAPQSTSSTAHASTTTITPTPLGRSYPPPLTSCPHTHSAAAMHTLLPRASTRCADAVGPQQRVNLSPLSRVGGSQQQRQQHRRQLQCQARAKTTSSRNTASGTAAAGGTTSSRPVGCSNANAATPPRRTSERKQQVSRGDTAFGGGAAATTTTRRQSCFTLQGGMKPGSVSGKCLKHSTLLCVPRAPRPPPGAAAVGAAATQQPAGLPDAKTRRWVTGGVSEGSAISSHAALAPVVPRPPLRIPSPGLPLALPACLSVSLIAQATLATCWRCRRPWPCLSGWPCSCTACTTGPGCRPGWQT